MGGSGTQAVGGAGTQAAGIAGNMQASRNSVEAPKPVPGWPASWQPPRVTPQPFEPLSFVLNAGQMRRGGVLS